MYLKNKLLARKRCSELALQTALKTWQRDPVEFKCPACGSDKVEPRPKVRYKNPGWCPICRHYFDQPKDFVCDCLEPGRSSKCHDCPNFHKLLASVKTIAEEMQAQSPNQT